MYLRHQAYTLYYRHVCILVFLHVFAYSMFLRCMLKFKRLACGSEDVTQYNTVTTGPFAAVSPWIKPLVTPPVCYEQVCFVRETFQRPL